MHVAYIGLGSNMGDKTANLKRAIEELGKAPGNKVLAVSSFYETEPVGNIDQDWFINAAVKIEPGLTPRELLEILLKIEKELGRVRDTRWGPRVIDLDILIYDDLVLNEEGLSIPHPYLHERGFVLAPLAEIAPGLIHPRLKKSMSELLKGLHDSKKIKKVRRTKV
ncbi:MAG: 2-amino-4-hydroxy-6-hydroxymethyldihydropteridine diphosphokinase [Deltaproteobacteria bacterium]|nr:2-amino-4-hydroxy-6-hydroxymethyldihydropteridine diphosphokinase [Deltaproteobacteria bacterium]